MQINNQDNIQVKTEDGWLISIRFQPWSDRVEIWIANRQNGKDPDICHFNKTGEMILTKIKEGAEPEPTMTINRYIWDGIKQAFQGIEETPDKKAVDAELSATKFHLSDMRKLLKLTSKVTE